MLTVNIPHISSFADDPGAAVADLKLDVLQNATSVTVKYNGLVSTAYSESTMRDEINTALASAGAWVRVSSMTKSGSAGTITFNILTPNNSQPLRLNTQSKKTFKLGRVPSSMEISANTTIIGPSYPQIQMYSLDMCTNRQYYIRYIYSDNSYGDVPLLYAGSPNGSSIHTFSPEYPDMVGVRYQLVLHTFLSDGRTIYSNILEETTNEWPYYSLVEVDPGDKYMSNDGTESVIRRYKLDGGGAFSQEQIRIMENIIAEMNMVEDYNPYAGPYVYIYPSYDAVAQEYILEYRPTGCNPHYDMWHYNEFDKDGISYTIMEGGFYMEVEPLAIEGMLLTEPYTRHAVKIQGVQQYVSYVLYRNGEYHDSYPDYQLGTDCAIFDDIYDEGTYTVKGVIEWPYVDMIGSYTVDSKIMHPPFKVYGGKQYYPAGTYYVKLTGSQIGVTYKLYRDGQYVAEKVGTTHYSYSEYPSFTVTEEGLYTIKAFYGSMELDMQGSYRASASVLLFDVMGERDPITGKSTIRLSGAQTDVHYRLYCNGLQVADKSAFEDDDVISFENREEVGIYTITGGFSSGNLSEVAMRGSYAASKLYIFSDKTNISDVNEPIILTLAKSDADKEYYLWKRNDGLSFGQQIKQGTGASLIFDDTSGPGEYYVEEIGTNIVSNTVKVSVEWPYQSLIAVPDEWSEVNVGNDGSPTYRTFLNIDFHLPTPEERAKLESILQDFNNGNVSSWDNRLQISLVSDPTSNRIVFKISGTINMGERIQSNHGFTVTSQSQAPIIQLGGWQIIPYEIGWYKDEANLESNNVMVKGKQNLIEYQLYRDDQYFAVMPEYQDSVVIFRDLPKEGSYKVKGIYQDLERFMSKELSVGDADIDFKRVSIITHTYTSPNDKVSDVTYYDGLGRSAQSIMIDKSLQGADIVKFTKYDIMGRPDSVNYLPYAMWGNNGAFRENPVNEQRAYYSSLSQYSNDADYAFSLKEYENSISNKVVSITQPGKTYQNGVGKHILYKYTFNSIADSVMSFTLNETTYAIQCTLYGQDRLSKYTETNEDGSVSITFKDNEDKLILSRRIGNANHRVDTYYVYDLLNRPCWVISPEGINRIKSQNITVISIDNDIAKQYCYIYQYDKFGNKKEQKLPGRGIDYFVYDMKGRIVMLQDAELRKSNNWVYNVYDGLGRDTHKAIVNCTMPHNEIQDKFYTTSRQEWLKNSIEPKPFSGDSSRVVILLSETLYGQSSSGNPILDFQPVSGIVDQTMVDSRIQQFKTYEKIAILDGNEYASPDYIEKAYYYDSEGRIIQIVENNHLDGISTSSFLFDYKGNVLKQHESHKTSVNAVADVLVKTFSYDSRSRLLSEETVLNNGQSAIVQYAYDNLGVLAAKTYGDQTAPIVDSVIYNIRGQVTDKRSDLFKMTLKYDNKSLPGGHAASYAGNISEWHWQHKDINGSTGPENIYAFTYDKMGRLISSNNYNVQSFRENMSYDDNGNTTWLERYSNGVYADDIIYEYTGNQLTALAETANPAAQYDVYPRGTSQIGTYQYDQNGNMTKDSRKNLEFEYNFLNLTSSVKEGNTVRSNYSWLADGKKLSARQSGINGGGYEYLGSLIYQYVNGQRQLESAAFGAGRIIANNGSQNTYTPNYYITDHLGSVRVIWDGANVVGRNDYYPSGTAWNTPNSMGSTDRFKYNGKEDQSLFGIDYLDYGARMYDPKLGRWHSVDPLSEKYYSLSPYNYTANNPIKYIDPDGMDYYLALFTGQISYFEGSADLFSTGYVNILAGENATMGQLQDALVGLGYEYKMDASVPGGFLVDTEKAYKGWAMMQIFSPENVGTILGLASSGGATAAEVGASKGVAKATANGVSKIADEAFASNGVTVLGKYPDYLNIASELGANKFQIPAKIWNSMSAAEQWAANMKFLDRAIGRGDVIVLSNRVTDINKVSGAFRQELDYLINRGYRLSSDGLKMVK